jgi:hypothetical protein
MAGNISHWLYRIGTKWLAIVSTMLFLVFWITGGIAHVSSN